MNFKVRLRRFIARHLGGLVEMVYQFKFSRLNFKKPPIIIITPGKVGSSSVYETLKQNTDHHVFHIHQLSKQGIKTAIEHHVMSDRKSKPLHLIVSKLLRKKLSSYNGPVKIITIVREPISREISAFFQNTEMHRKTIEDGNLEIDNDQAKHLLTSKLKSDICQELLDWFESEIKGNFEIDVFSKKIDASKKYSIYKHQNTHLLLLKMEDLNRAFPEAVQDFLDLESPMSLIQANIGSNKHYAASYKTLKEDIILEKATIETIVTSTYFKHFYDDMTKEVTKQWVRDT